MVKHLGVVTTLTVSNVGVVSLSGSKAEGMRCSHRQPLNTHHPLCSQHRDLAVTWRTPQVVRKKQVGEFWLPQVMKSEGGGEISYLGHKTKLTHNNSLVLVVLGEICLHKEMKMGLFFFLRSTFFAVKTRKSREVTTSWTGTLVPLLLLLSAFKQSAVCPTRVKIKSNNIGFQENEGGDFGMLPPRRPACVKFHPRRRKEVCVRDAFVFLLESILIPVVLVFVRFFSFSYVVFF